MVAMIASLGANLIVTTSTNPHFQEREEESSCSAKA